MGKGVKIALVCLEFIAFAVGGYFIGEVLPSGSSIDSPKIEEEVIVLSPVPVLEEVAVSKPFLGKDGKYSFDAVATVENGDSLIYVLYADENCQKLVVVTGDGKFAGVLPSASQKYYVCAKNVKTGDMSSLVVVDGFIKPQPEAPMYNKITESELYNIFENGIMVVEKGFNRRLAPGFKITVNGLKDGDSVPSKPEDIYGKLLNGVWASVSIAEPLKYDTQGRLTKLVVTVKYPS